MFGLNRELQILDGPKREVRVLTGKIKSFIVTIGSTRRNCCEKRSTQIPIMFCHDKSNGNVSCRLRNWSVPKGQLASVVTNSTMAMTRSKIRWSPCKKKLCISTSIFFLPTRSPIPLLLRIALSIIGAKSPKSTNREVM
jgi:hypothetical protein